MTVPYTFANQSGQVPASELDANFTAVSLNVNTANTVVNPAQANITTVGTLTSLSVAGTVTANLIVGNIAGSIANATYANTAGYANTATTANTATSAGTATAAITAEVVSNAAQPAITSVGTLTLLTVTGTVTAGQFSGSGNTLSNISGANVTGAVANATYALTANSASYVTNALQANVANTANAVAGGNVSGQVANALIAGTVYTNAQPNITSVGTLANAYTSGVVSAVGNVTGGNILTGGQVSAAGNITGTNVTTSQSIQTGGYISATSTVIGGGFSTTGNITTGNVILPANGTITSANSKITFDNSGQIILSSISGNSAFITTDNDLDFYTAGLSNYSELWLHDGGNAVISTNGTTHNWEFGLNGDLTAPGNITLPANSGIASSNAGITLDSVGQITINPGFVTSPGGLDFYTASANNYSELWLFDEGNAVISTAGETHNWIFGLNGDLTAPGNVAANCFIGNGSQLTSVAHSTTGSWTLATGTNTVSLTVPGPGTYSIWVNGNIPNGIVTYTAMVVVTNNNAPVVGSSYGWYYAAGNALVLTAIPTQIVGSLNNISTAVVVTTTANVFTFGITNNSGNSAVVDYGYTVLS